MNFNLDVLNLDKSKDINEAQLQNKLDISRTDEVLISPKLKLIINIY